MAIIPAGVLGVVLASPLPMVLAWGADLITLHDDEYRPLLGNKPGAIGRPFLEVWPDARGTLGPILDRALAVMAAALLTRP